MDRATALSSQPLFWPPSLTPSPVRTRFQQSQGLLNPLGQFLSQSWQGSPGVLLQSFGITLEELLSHPLNPAGTAEVPRDKAESRTGHYLLKARTQDRAQLNAKWV